MSILKYKYKAHKFINYAFYIVVFIFGFLLGFTTQKLDFNKLISQVLMIDSVSALDFENKYHSQDNLEDHIYNSFTTAFENFNIEEYSNIICNVTSDSKDWFYYTCVALNDVSRNNLAYSPYSSEGINYYIGSNNNPVSYYQVQYSFISNGQVINEINYYELSTLYKENVVSSPLPTFSSIYVNSKVSYGNYTFSNFDINHEDFNDFNSSINVLDFSGSNLKFNENLFKDNPDFKEVCVDKGKKYSITTTNVDPITNSIFVSDFLWFPGKVTGVKYSEYDSLEDDNILVFNDDVSTENYYFKDKEKIDLLYNDEIISNYFIHSGYTDKYSLYGYTAYKFIHSYYVDDDNNSQNMFTIFDFTDMNFSPFGSAGGSSGSFGDTPLTYCFYIKNEFNVTELQTNEWDDYVGTVPTPGGDLDVITSHNKNNSSDKVDSFFSTINNVISELRPTINFIKEHIEQLYLSMPLIVRSFIISFLVLILISILIGMVVK